MTQPIKVPPLGESITEATIGTILKPSGSFVKADEEILELETDKVNQPIYAPVAGIVQIEVKTGDVVKVGQVIGSIDPKEAPAAAPSPAKPKESPPLPQNLPAIRKSSEELLQSTPPATPRPVMPKEQPSVSGTRKKMSKLRKIVAQKLVEVKNQTAMLTTFNEVDMSQIIAVREKEQESFQKKFGVKLGFMSFFVKACTAALQAYPDINARIEGDEIVYPDHTNMGIAVSTEKGLMVPVLKEAEKMSCADIEKKLKEFAEQARTGTLSIDALQGGTFTITNGGVFGSLLSTPILNPPQSGILGMHSIVKRPVAVDDQVVIRPMMYIALSYDHRIVDGKEAISFLTHIRKNLEDPARFLLEL